MRKGAKKDANHAAIVAALIKAGCSVLDLSMVGGGMPDILAGIAGKNYLIEIKNPDTYYGRKGLSKRQREFAEKWIGEIFIVRSIDEALVVVGLKRGPDVPAIVRAMR